MTLKPTQPARDAAPKRIWLLDYGGPEPTWCDDPDPTGTADPADAIAYVRADIAQAERLAAAELGERLARWCMNTGYDGNPSGAPMMAAAMLASLSTPPEDDGTQS